MGLFAEERVRAHVSVYARISEVRGFALSRSCLHVTMETSVAIHQPIATEQKVSKRLWGWRFSVLDLPLFLPSQNTPDNSPGGELNQLVSSLPSYFERFLGKGGGGLKRWSTKTVISKSQGMFCFVSERLQVCPDSQGATLEGAGPSGTPPSQRNYSTFCWVWAVVGGSPQSALRPCA